MSKSDRDVPVSLHGLTPEEALRALLAVKPEDAEPEGEAENDDAPGGRPGASSEAG